MNANQDRSEAAGEKPWGLARRVAFRFAAAYFFIYCFPNAMGLIPRVDPTWKVSTFVGSVVPLQVNPTLVASRYVDKLIPLYAEYVQLYIGKFAGKYNEKLHEWVPWVGEHVLHLSYKITVFPGGSGDTTYNYVELLCFAAFALAVTFLWTLTDLFISGPHRYPITHDWLRIYVRYVLAMTMLGYGISKVIKLQFRTPGLDLLMQTYGESSPMRLLWTFMGFSTSYTFFAGAGEVLGGLLLFLRRTTTLGSLVVIGVMSNVVMMNFSYDVPVKLYSANLLVMAVFLTIPDLGRLMNLLVLDRPASAPNWKPPFRWWWMNQLRNVAKVVVIGLPLFVQVKGSLDSQKVYGEKAPKPSLYGMYFVDEFLRNGDPQELLLTDTTQWRRLIFNEYGQCTIRLMDDSLVYSAVAHDEANHKITLRTIGANAKVYVFNYTRPDADHLELSGDYLDDEIDVSLRKAPESAFLLTSRGFHWINETPFNR